MNREVRKTKSSPVLYHSTHSLEVFACKNFDLSLSVTLHPKNSKS